MQLGKSLRLRQPLLLSIELRALPYLWEKRNIKGNNAGETGEIESLLRSVLVLGEPGTALSPIWL